MSERLSWFNTDDHVWQSKSFALGNMIADWEIVESPDGGFRCTLWYPSFHNGFNDYVNHPEEAVDLGYRCFPDFKVGELAVRQHSNAEAGAGSPLSPNLLPYLLNSQSACQEMTDALTEGTYEIGGYEFKPDTDDS